MSLELTFENEVYTVPSHIRGQNLIKTINRSSTNNLYLRKSQGEVIKLVRSNEYTIEKGDMIQELDDFFLG